MYIYILKLVKNKYYVGKTKNPNFRLNEHFKNGGSSWTKKYKPISVEEIVSDCDDYDEDKYVRMYMDKYGIDNVRGGSFSQIDLPEHVLATLVTMEDGTNDKCFRCGRKGHFVSKCFATYDVDGDIIESSDDEDVIFCSTCGRDGHTRYDCYAKKTIDGEWIMR